MSRRTFIAAGLAMLLPARGLAQQQPAPVAKPDVKVGDRWVYRHTDRA